jgi:branched-chain amino acid transport system ATP-binding protein
VTNPSLLLLDEPVEGLAPLIVAEMLSAIRAMRRESGLTIVLVEQKHELALAQGERCAVIDHGSVIYTGASNELLADEPLLERLLGVAA